MSKQEHWRRLRVGASWVTLIGVLVAVVALLNLVVSLVTVRVDLTADRRHSIAPYTQELLAGLEQPLRVIVFLSGELPAPYHLVEREVSDLLQDMRASAGGRLTFTIVDPALDEADAERAMNFGILPFTIGEQSRDALSFREVYMGMALVLESAADDEVAIIEQLFPGMNLEYEIARRLRDLTRDGEAPTLGFVVNDGSFFGELIDQAAQDPRSGGRDEIKSLLRTQLEDQLFEGLFRIRLVDAGEDALDELDALVFLGPTRRLSDEALRAVDEHVQAGRGLAVFTSRWRMADAPPEIAPRGMFPPSPEPNETGLEPLLEAYGVLLQNDILLDREAGQISVQDRTIGYYGDQPISAPVPLMDPRLPVITRLDPASILVPNLPLLAFQPMDRTQPLPVSSLAVTGAAREREAADLLRVVEVASTNPTSVRRPQGRPLSLEEASTPTPNETQGSFPVIATLEGTLPSWADPGALTTSGRLLVASNGEFITSLFNPRDPLRDPRLMGSMPPQIAQTVQQYNLSSLLFLRNAADWLAADPGLIAIRGRGLPVFLDPELLQRESAMRLQAANVLGVPLVFLLIGLGVWWARTRRKHILQQRFALLKEG